MFEVYSLSLIPDYEDSHLTAVIILSVFFVAILRVWFEYGCNVWLFSHERYTVEVGGRSMGKVIVLGFTLGSHWGNTCSKYW